MLRSDGFLMGLRNFNVTDVVNNNDDILIAKDYVSFLRWKNKKRNKIYVLVSTENLNKFLEDNKWWK